MGELCLLLVDIEAVEASHLREVRQTWRRVFTKNSKALALPTELLVLEGIYLAGG